MVPEYWPFEYYNTLSTIKEKMDIELYYDIDKDDFIKNIEKENYRVSRTYLIAGNKKSINKLYRDIKNGTAKIKESNIKLIDKLVMHFEPSDKLIGNGGKLVRFIDFLVKNNIIKSVDVPSFNIYGVKQKRYQDGILITGSVPLYGDNSKNTVTMYPNKRELLLYMKNSNKQYVFFNLGLLEIPGISAGHSNLIIIDKIRKTVERFEPHGKMVHFNDKYVDDFIIDKFVNPLLSLSKKYKYVHMLNYCPDIGPQTKQKLSSKNTNSTSFCATWSTLYLHFKLINPHLPSNIIINHLVNKSPDYLYDLITRYQTFIDYIVPDSL